MVCGVIVWYYGVVVVPYDMSPIVRVWQQDTELEVVCGVALPAGFLFVSALYWSYYIYQVQAP